MKTTTLVTVLAVASFATAAPTTTDPDAALEKKDAGPDADSDDTFTHMLFERDNTSPAPRGGSADGSGADGAAGGDGKGGAVGDCWTWECRCRQQ